MQTTPRTSKLPGQVTSRGDEDDVFYDACRKRVCVSCGEGFLAVFDASGAITRVRTSAGRSSRVTVIVSAPETRT